MKEVTPRTISIPSDSYAMWGERSDGPPDPPDKTTEQREAERKVGEIPEDELLKARKWTPADLDLALRRGFPRPTTRLRVARLSFQLTRVRVYSRVLVADWERTTRALLQV